MGWVGVHVCMCLCVCSKQTTQTKKIKKIKNSAAEPPEEFLCPISLEIMRDPVIMVETAMTYDRASIEQHFASGQDNCPLSGRTLVSKRMIPNYNLRSAIESWAKLHGMPWPSLDVPPRGTPRPEALPRSGSLRTGSPMAPLTGVRSMDPVEGPCDAVHLEAMSSGDTVALTMATLSSEVPVLVAELEHAAPEVAEAIVRKICELTDKNNDARVQMRYGVVYTSVFYAHTVCTHAQPQSMQWYPCACQVAVPGHPREQGHGCTCPVVLCT